jgi:hypothetical protein
VRHEPKLRAVVISTTSAFATGFIALFVACADSSAENADVAEGGTALPSSDGSLAPDVSSVLDAGPDADSAVAPRICSDDGFCHSVVPKGHSLTGVWGDGTGVVWAASEEGSVLRWNGTGWTVHATIEGAASSIWGSGPTDIWIATTSGLVHGQGASSAEVVFTTVTGLPGDASIPIRSVSGTASNDVWAAGGADLEDGFPPYQKGRLLHWDGTEWTVDDELASQGVGYRALWGNPTSGIWVHGIDNSAPFEGYRARLFRRRPGASAWTSIDLPDDPNGGPRAYAAEVRAANVSSDSSVWLYGASGLPNVLVWHGVSTDSGVTFTWSAKRLDYWERPITAYWGAAANDTWAVGELGRVTRFDGASWKQAAIRVTGIPVAETFRGIWGTSSEDFWVVGGDVALHRTNAGKP